ncbi:MAG: hypothetical protein ACKPCI_08990 [Dolichospermum sp.]
MSDRTPQTQKAIPTERFAIALPKPQKSDSYGALRYRTSTNLKKRFLRSASLSHTQTPKTAIPTERFAIAPFHNPNSDSYGALRYRTPQNPKQRSHFPKPSKSDRTSPNLKIAIAPPHPNSDRTPYTPKQRSHPLNTPNSDPTTLILDDS